MVAAFVFFKGIDCDYFSHLRSLQYENSKNDKKGETKWRQRFKF